MKYALATLLAFFLVTATVTGRPYTPLTTVALPAAGPIVIGDDYGGRVSTYLEFYQRIFSAGIFVKVKGICVSACTLVLELPGNEVCVYPTASFGFHLASIDNIANPVITDVMVRRYYPPSVQKWIAEHGPLKEDPIYMSAATLVKLGVFPFCRD